jgi:hypothetical protein
VTLGPTSGAILSLPSGSPPPPPPPPPPPVPAPIVLTLTVSGTSVNLAWSGISGHRADVYRNGARLTTTQNDGSFSDKLPRRATGTFSYKVCAAGTSTCSAVVSIQIGGSVSFSPKIRARRLHGYGPRRARRSTLAFARRR